MGTARSFRRVAVAICNPRIMRRFKELADRMKVTYTVPDIGERVVEADIVIADEECAEHYVLKAGEVIKVAEGDIRQAILCIIGKEEVSVLSVGIDLGSRLAYAVFADENLIAADYAMSYVELLKVINELTTELAPARVEVKVGIPTTDEYYDWLPDFLMGAIDMGVDVYLVEEDKTSSKPLRSFPGVTYVKSKDIDAAINIVFREGIRVGREG